MKIAVLIPDRGDRPALLANCVRMMEAQTLRPAHIEIVNDAPLSGEKDITLRYRLGYDRLRGKGFDLIAFIENDDWYHPTYLEFMINQWLEHGKPNMLGTNQTIYYHLYLRMWFTMVHPERSSAMNTFIKPDLDFSWCVDNYPYTDIHLWMVLKLGGVIIDSPNLSIGMKHGEGLCGGRNHKDGFERFINADYDLQFLKEKMDSASFNFYSGFYLRPQIS